MTWVITKCGLAVLRALHGSREAKQRRGFGWNAGDFGGKRAAATARVLERKGYVEVEHISDVHKRYSITTSGEQLVRSIDAGRPWKVRGYRPDGGEAVHSQPSDQAPAEPPSSSNTEG